MPASLATPAAAAHHAWQCSAIEQTCGGHLPLLWVETLGFETWATQVGFGRQRGGGVVARRGNPLGRRVCCRHRRAEQPLELPPQHQVHLGHGYLASEIGEAGDAEARLGDAARDDAGEMAEVAV